jgi:hypothetical protein
MLFFFYRFFLYFLVWNSWFSCHLSNHHHSNVSILLSNIYIPLKISSIFYPTTFYIPHMLPYQIYVWINIIVSNEYWWEYGIIWKNQINLLRGVKLIDYLTCKMINVWKHIFNQFMIPKFGIGLLSNSN